MSTDTIIPKVVVWGADNYNTLGILRSLGNENFDILMLVRGSKHGVATASKYCTKCYYTYSTDEGVAYLTEHYPEEANPNKRAVLIPGGDATSLATSKHYAVLHKRFHLMCTHNPKMLEEVMDKNIMCKIAEDAGILVPKSQKYHVGITEFYVPFPVILKPVYSEGRVEFKTKVFNTPNDLIKFSKYLNPKNQYIMQQFIKRSYDIVVYGCKLPNGELKLAGHHTLERWSDDGGGSYGHLSPDIPKYLHPETLDRFFEILGYQGEFSAEYGFVNGKAYFYEVNFRNDGFCHLALQAGANLPLLWVCSCLNIPFAESYKMKEPVVGINEIYDVINVWRRNISWRKYRKDLHEAKAFHYYDSNDLLPYKNMHRRMFWEIPFRALLKTLRPQIVWILNKLGK